MTKLEKSIKKSTTIGNVVFSVEYELNDTKVQIKSVDAPTIETNPLAGFGSQSVRQKWIVKDVLVYKPTREGNLGLYRVIGYKDHRLESTFEQILRRDYHMGDEGYVIVKDSRPIGGGNEINFELIAFADTVRVLAAKLYEKGESEVLNTIFAKYKKESGGFEFFDFAAIDLYPTNLLTKFTYDGKNFSIVRNCMWYAQDNRQNISEYMFVDKKGEKKFVSLKSQFKEGTWHFDITRVSRDAQKF